MIGILKRFRARNEDHESTIKALQEQRKAMREVTAKLIEQTNEKLKVIREAPE